MAKESSIRIDKIIELLNNVFHGGAWHGSSVLELTKGLSIKEAGFNAGNVHTIAEIIYHITSWRIFTLKKLQGDAEYNVDTDKKDWGNIGVLDQFELETLMMELTLSHDELMSALNNREDSFLAETVPGAEYDFFTLLTGMVNHDVYHAGQIALIKKIAGKAKPSSETSSSRYFEDELEDDFI